MVVTVNNIAYDLKHGLKTDIYYPNDTDSQTKILIFWHGGGWFRGSKESIRDVAIDLANAGFMTFVPDYRLAPADHFPAAHEDALNFAAWLLASNYTDEGDENNIVQIGASSGGTLALKGGRHVRLSNRHLVSPGRLQQLAGRPPGGQAISQC